MANPRSLLIRQLQNAFSGEKAAAYAYRGHAFAMRDSVESARILQIEQEEWDHRSSIGKMLAQLGSKPRLSREVLMTLVGVVIFSLCRIGGWLNIFGFGWFMSMYGAGKLEQSNIIEYEVAALSAFEAGHPEFIEDLIHMAEVEWDHEIYFRLKANESRCSRWIKIWTPPPPRETTRLVLMARRTFANPYS